MKSIIPLLCFILAGCSSMSVFQSPGVLPKGKTETGIGAFFILNSIPQQAELLSQV